MTIKMLDEMLPNQLDNLQLLLVQRLWINLYLFSKNVWMIQNGE